MARASTTNGTDAEVATAPARPGNPLDGLWHWTDHPAVRAGFVAAVLIAVLVAFPLIAQWTF